MKFPDPQENAGVYEHTSLPDQDVFRFPDDTVIRVFGDNLHDDRLQLFHAALTGDQYFIGVLKRGWQHNWLLDNNDFRQDRNGPAAGIKSWVQRSNGRLRFGNTGHQEVTIPAAAEVALTRAMTRWGLFLPLGVNTRDESLSMTLLRSRST